MQIKQAEGKEAENKSMVGIVEGLFLFFCVRVV